MKRSVTKNETTSILLNTKKTSFSFFRLIILYCAGADPEIFKRWGRRGGEGVRRSILATMVDRQKKILDFRWSKKAEMRLETIRFWQNISISVFKFSAFLSIKSYQFLKIY